MTDIIDIASERETFDREMAIEDSKRRARATSPPPTGRCANCEEPLPDGDSFCDTDCTTDYEKRQRMRGATHV